MQTIIPLCACGCGDTVVLTREGRPNTYLRGHNHRGKPKSAEQLQKQSAAMKGRPGPWLGKSIPLSARQKMSESAKKKRLSPEHRRKIGEAGKGRILGEDTLAKLRGRRHSPETRRKQSLAQKGDKGSGWRGGVTHENRIARASAEFREWREAVYRRDSFACRSCGSKKDIHAHHIKPFAMFLELRFVVSNGLTLCKSCHDIVHGRT